MQQKSHRQHQKTCQFRIPSIHQVNDSHDNSRRHITLDPLLLYINQRNKQGNIA